MTLKVFTCKLFTPILKSPITVENISKFQFTQDKVHIEMSNKFELPNPLCPIKEYKISRVVYNNKNRPKF